MASPDPDAASLAEAVTRTLVPRVNEAPLLGAVTVTVGAAASIRICLERTVSLLPALSVDAYLTVVVCVSAKGAVYVTAEVLVFGLLPSMV